MKKSFGKLVLLCSCVTILSGCVSSKLDYEIGTNNLPWNYSPPYEDMTPEEREDVAEDAFRDYRKQKGEEIWEYAKENWEWISWFERTARQIRDKHLTIKAGELPEDPKAVATKKRNISEEEEKKFFVLRPGGKGLEAYAANESRIGFSLGAGIRGLKTSIDPRFTIPIPFTQWKLPLPALETGYDMENIKRGKFDGELSVEAMYKFSW